MTSKESEIKKEFKENGAISGDSPLKQAANDELLRLGSGGPWLWKLFFLCVLPNILNGFHVSSYIFLSPLPEAYWCELPELTQNTNWTTEQIREISSPNSNTSTCEVYNYDYSKFHEMSYNEAYLLINTTKRPETVGCLEKNRNSEYHYQQHEGASIVPEWQLVCENLPWRSTVQVALSLGKFLGASIFGIIADRFGRKRSYMIGSLVYIISGVITTASPWYWLFMIGRMGLGAAGAAIFYSSYTLLSENVHPKHRSWMCLAHSISYPIGMLFLSLSAYLVTTWRTLQMVLTIPSFLMLLFCYLIKESPRWLISKGREAEAYRDLFNKDPDVALVEKSKCYEEKPLEKTEDEITFKTKVKKSMNELIQLYGPSKVRNRVLICHFNWCVISMSYYITALNADNFKANRYLYVAVTGLVDAPSYVLSILFSRYMGRKTTCSILFLLAGVSLLLVLAVPKEYPIYLIILSMSGRFGISAVYAVMTLHTSEIFPTEIRNSALGTSSTMAHIGSISAPYIVDLLGQVGWYIPTTICGTTITIAFLLTLLLPETKDKALTDHVDDELKENESNDSVEGNRIKN